MSISIRSTVVTSRVLIAGVFAVAAAAPARAQQPVELPNHATLKNQVRIFELVVQDAVRRGGTQLNQKAREIQPRVGLQMMGPPIVTGVYLPEQGYHFDVQVPDILPTSLNLFTILQNQPQAQGASRPVSGTVGPTGVVRDDPMKAPAAAAADFDPQRAYGDYVRDMLVEALIDNSGALPVRAGERVTVRARVPQMFVNPLALMDERELLLSVLADDLLAFRQGQISRADMQQRIREYRY
jgi:hypothetical protein